MVFFPPTTHINKFQFYDPDYNIVDPAGKLYIPIFVALSPLVLGTIMANVFL